MVGSAIFGFFLNLGELLDARKPEGPALPVLRIAVYNMNTVEYGAYGFSPWSNGLSYPILTIPNQYIAWRNRFPIRQSAPMRNGHSDRK